MPAEESDNQATKTQSTWSCITVEWLIKWGSLRAFCTWRLPKWAVNDDIPPFFLSQTFFSENANKQRCITSFSLRWNNWASLLINDDIHLFFSPSALPRLPFKHKLCICMETVINLFPIVLPMTPFSAVRLGTHWTLGHDRSEDIPNPPELFTLRAIGLIEKKCLVGYVVSATPGISSLFLSLDNGTAFDSPLSYKKSDHCTQLEPRLSFLSLCLLTPLLIVCVFRPGAECLWGGGELAFMWRGHHAVREMRDSNTCCWRNHRAVNSWVRLIRCAVFCGFSVYLQPATDLCGHKLKMIIVWHYVEHSQLYIWLPHAGY